MGYELLEEINGIRPVVGLSGETKQNIQNIGRPQLMADVGFRLSRPVDYPRRKDGWQTPIYWEY